MTVAGAGHQGEDNTSILHCDQAERGECPGQKSFLPRLSFYPTVFIEVNFWAAELLWLISNENSLCN